MLIVVRIGAQRFAISAESVERMLRMAALTPAPDLPLGVAGVMNLRGRTGLVIGPRPRIGQLPVAPDPAQALLVTRGEAPFLVWVDGVEGTLDAGPSELEPVSIDGNRVPLIPALVRRPDGVLPLLSLEALDPSALFGGAHQRVEALAK